MKFNFFTFGGSVFWQDVFFYQKWRIQRHYFSKKYRLLDSWDIRRSYGSFEKCRRDFIKYIESYEITKQKGKMIILLHGYADGKNIFKPLWRKLILTNTTVAAINYPSLFCNSLTAAHQLAFFLNHMEDITEVSFVTKGCGNLVLQRTFNLSPDLQVFRSKMRIGNIVEINPVVRENPLCERLARFKFSRFILGPMLQDFTLKSLNKAPILPLEFNVLRIFSSSKFASLVYKLLKIIIFRPSNDIIKSPHELNISNSTFNSLKDAEILNYTINFISNGKI